VKTFENTATIQRPVEEVFAFLEAGGPLA